jgi:hypothetical protein
MLSESNVISDNDGGPAPDRVNCRLDNAFGRGEPRLRAGSGAGIADEAEESGVTVMRLGGPVLGDFGKRAMLDGIPFGSAGGVVSNGYCEPKVVAELGLKFGFPGAGTATVADASSDDEQLPRGGSDQRRRASTTRRWSGRRRLPCHARRLRRFSLSWRAGHRYHTGSLRRWHLNGNRDH